MKMTIASLTISLAVTSAVSHALPCANRLGGSWNFGTVPYSCNVSPLQSPEFVRTQYAPVLFNDAHINNEGRRSYMSKMYPSIREMGHYYIHRRNPQVSVGEEEGFLAALYAVVSQESNWSHYRQGTDAIIRSMRGDSLHGYGIMQIDDRAHATPVGQGKATDLVGNLLLGLDQFYAEWVRSARVSCVPSASDYRARARSAWAAYNGGSGSICRWTNLRSAWAQNDSSFKAHYDGRSWISMVGDRNAKSPINITCLAEGKRPCVNP